MPVWWVQCAIPAGSEHCYQGSELQGVLKINCPSTLSGPPQAFPLLFFLFISNPCPLLTNLIPLVSAQFLIALLLVAFLEGDMPGITMLLLFLSNLQASRCPSLSVTWVDRLMSRSMILTLREVLTKRHCILKARLGLWIRDERTRSQSDGLQIHKTDAVIA